MSQRTIIDGIPSVAVFQSILAANTGLVVVKFGAQWCKPCQTIRPIVHAFFATSPSAVICVEVDVDEYPELYIELKRRRQINGIPVILAWKQGNTDLIPDFSVTGGDPIGLDAFFRRCGEWLATAPLAAAATAAPISRRKAR